MIKRLNLKEMEYIAHSLAKHLMDFNEPIPDFSTRFPNKLESCIETPFVTFDGRYLYRGITLKAAVLFYLLIKNHPFQNGNKRIAVTALLIFLMKNKKWIHVGIQEFYNFAIWVAQSPPDVQEATISGIEKFIKKYLKDF